MSGATSHPHKCPVYKCTFSAKTEDELIAHYEEQHADLVKLGMKLTKSDETRKQQKHKKKNTITILDDHKKKDKGAESDKESESSFSVYENSGESDCSSDSVNSELEDLYELEKIELAKRKERRQGRGRPQRGGGYDEDPQLDDDIADEDDPDSQENEDGARKRKTNSRLESIRAMIAQKKQKKQKKMKGVLTS